MIFQFLRLIPDEKNQDEQYTSGITDHFTHTHFYLGWNHHCHNHPGKKYNYTVGKISNFSVMNFFFASSRI